MLRHKFALFGLLLLAAINVSCDRQEVYYQYHELKDAKWGYKDTLTYVIDSSLFEINVPYRLTIELTNGVGYPYQNIWLFMQTDLDNDSVYTESSREYMLADEFGKWYGSGFGSLFQSTLDAGQVVFKEKRSYRIWLEHGMRDESLPGIEKVGIKVSK